ncbi:unnamed protein product [Didymodactylos carnosus]|uniref:Protein SMG7 n=1 Tax=Didymodactylos carnosus TaxID=1234261 RepID=A0A813QV05_9BILA|nr:unnamed protein product [Didymodactylos carnosus]CAF0847965.1 unnamed protein product [Didymodactylos carnosus]CAF3555750.1 unnamed protein product [Didymodactylos carnosus]CAF3633229.1 unnamed protein product [Didymodactylos carnosus]
MASSSNKRSDKTNRRRQHTRQLSTINNLSSNELYQQCEILKKTIQTISLNKPEAWYYRQQLLEAYQKLILFDLDYSIDKKIEHDLWNIVFKSQITYKQEQLKGDKRNIKRNEIQTNLQSLYEYARGYYMKLLQNVVQYYNFNTSICKHYNFLKVPQRSTSAIGIGENMNRKCKEASLLYFTQHILVHVGDFNRYSNQIDLAKSFYLNAIHIIPCFGQPYNQIGILYEMKTSSTAALFVSLAQNQLITAYYYVRSIAIKVTFPLAITNLEKLFTRLKDISIQRYTTEQKLNEKDFITLFLQIIAMINLEHDLDKVKSFIDILKLTMINTLSSSTSNFDRTSLCQIVVIVMFTFHRALGLLPLQSNQPQPQHTQPDDETTANTTARSYLKSTQQEKQYDLIVTLFVTIIEQCLEAIHLPLSLMVIDEHHLLPALYLSFAYLTSIHKQKSKTTTADNNLFSHPIFKQKTTFWTNLAKLLRSFGVYASSLNNNEEGHSQSDKTPSSSTTTSITSSLFNRCTDYPLKEERMLECFLPLKDLLVSYSFKKYSNETMCLSEKDERQLRKLRLVHMIKCLCQNNSGAVNSINQKTNILSSQQSFGHLTTFVKDEIVCFESTSLHEHTYDKRTIQRNIREEDPRLYNPNKTAKPVRGARNVALRQFLEPALAAAMATSSTTSSVETGSTTHTPTRNGTTSLNNGSTSSNLLTQNNIPQLMQINTGLVSQGVLASQQLQSANAPTPLPPQLSSGYTGNTNFGSIMYGRNMDNEQQQEKTPHEASIRSNGPLSMMMQQMDDRQQDFSMGINENRSLFYNEQMHKPYSDNINMVDHSSCSLLGWPPHPPTHDTTELKEGSFLRSNDSMFATLDYRSRLSSVWSSGINSPLQAQPSPPSTSINIQNTTNTSTNRFSSPFIQSSYPYNQNTSSQPSPNYPSYTNHLPQLPHPTQMLAPGLMFSQHQPPSMNSANSYRPNLNDSFKNSTISPPPGMMSNLLKEPTSNNNEHMHLKTVQQQQQQQQYFPSILWPMQRQQMLNTHMQNGQEQPD